MSFSVARARSLPLSPFKPKKQCCRPLPLLHARSMYVKNEIMPVVKFAERQSGMNDAAVALTQDESLICSVCFETLSDADILFTCDDCGTPCCAPCMKRYCEMRIEEGQVQPNQFICPGYECGKPMEQSRLLQVLDEATIERYFYFLENNRPGARFCPVRSCGAILKEEPFSTKRKMICQRCSTTSCARCGKAYHPIGLCRRTESGYRRWRGLNNVRGCPRCNWEIEKVGGCSHMTCSRCAYEFCWHCTQDWLEHDEFLCVPLSLYHSENKYYGPTRPIRFLTKSLTATVASGVVVVGSGAALVIVPVATLYGSIKRKVRRHRVPPPMPLNLEPLPLTRSQAIYPSPREFHELPMPTMPDPREF